MRYNIRRNVWIWPCMIYAFIFLRTIRARFDVIGGAWLAFAIASLMLYFLYAYVRVPDMLRARKGCLDIRQWPKDARRSLWRFMLAYCGLSLILTVASVLQKGF